MKTKKKTSLADDMLDGFLASQGPMSKAQKKMWEKAIKNKSIWVQTVKDDEDDEDEDEEPEDDMWGDDDDPPPKKKKKSGDSPQVKKLKEKIKELETELKRYKEILG